MVVREYKGPERRGPDMLIKLVFLGVITLMIYLTWLAPRPQPGCLGQEPTWVVGLPTCDGLVPSEE